MKYLGFLMLAGVLLLLNACGGATARPTPTTISPTQVAGTPTIAVDTPEPTVEPGNPTDTPTTAVEPTSEPTTPPSAPPTANQGSASVTATPDLTPPDVTPQPTLVNTDTMAADLERLLNSRITPTPVGSTGSSIEGVRAFRLQGGKSPLWVAYTYGFRSLDPQQNHYVAIYAKPNEKWQELSRLELDLPDYVDPGSVTQIQIEPTQIWLRVEGGLGPHSGAFYVLRFDGTALRKEIEFSNSMPGVGEVRDVNGDGTLDVILNEGDAYIFCYACSVRLLNFGIMRWDGTKMVRVELEPISGTAPAEASRLNDLAIKEAKGELWKTAKENIEKAKALAPQDKTLAWNAGLIGVTADARQAHIQDTGLPLLATVFYGDYDAAIASIRRYSPDALFGPQTPIIFGTPAEGNEDSLRKNIIETTTKALAVDPNLAGAYFLRGWAEFTPGQKSAAATADIKRAATLNPSEKLFQDAVAYMANK